MIREEKLKDTIFFVEANSFETLTLWKEYKDEIKWVQDHEGFMETLGYIDDNVKKPVCVTFLFNILNDKRICFFDVTSRFSDMTMIEEWLDKNYPVKWDRGTRVARTDAMNFHHVIDCIKNGRQ